MSVVDRVESAISRRRLLEHPFYQHWSAGTLPLENLREYARQYYAFESSFPRFLSTIHSKSPDPVARQSILENLWDEEHGPDNHAELWLRFAEGVGAGRDDVMSARWNPATARLVDVYEGICSTASTAAAVAAVYAYERQVPEVAKAKIDGLERHFGVTDDRSLAFFRVHAGLDVAHAEAERRIIAKEGEVEAEEVEEAARTALAAWWRFLDAVSPAAA